LTNVEIHINNTKLQQDGSSRSLHPNGSGDGAYYFCTDDDDENIDFNKKINSPDPKRQKLDHRDDGMDNQQDFLSSLVSSGSNDPSFINGLLMTNNAFRLGAEEDNFTNQFLCDDRD